MLLRQHFFIGNRMKSYETLRKLHPCLSRTGEGGGRIHLPVSPSCNLCCRYCRRSLNFSGERPGSAFRILPVEEVSGILEQAIRFCPELTTVGIAGPGEALATRHAMEAFEIVDREFPDRIKCLSTNGLLLKEKAEELAKIHVDSVTVTVNAVRPGIQSKINKRILYGGRWIYGEEAAKILIENQLEGIKTASGLGMTVKINTVLIPGINDDHIEQIAEETSAAGARICNIIPLIPQADLAEVPAPECGMIDKARSDAGQFLDVFRHCRHCRADAAGKLNGEDLGIILYGGIPNEEANFSHG